MAAKSKRLRIMAGPNGSGKSTILKAIRNKFYSGPFVNADEIEKSFKEKKLLNPFAEYSLQTNDKDFNHFIKGPGKSWIEKAAKENSTINIESVNGILLVKNHPSPYDAALAADFIRYKMVELEETFTFETVLSHPSKINFLQESKDSGYKNYLYFICTVSPEINIKRVEARERLGGHGVPVERIKKRYFESLKVLPQIIPLCYRVYLFDNSSEERSMEPIAEIDNKQELIIRNEQVPWWVQEFVINSLYL